MPVANNPTVIFIPFNFALLPTKYTIELIRLDLAGQVELTEYNNTFAATQNGITIVTDYPYLDSFRGYNVNAQMRIRLN